MPNIVALLLERADTGALDAAWELRAAARRVAAGGRIGVVLVGRDVGATAAELARGFDDVWVFDDPSLATSEAGLDATLFASVVAREAPFLTLAMHTNLAIDLAPTLAVALDVPMLPDVLSLEARDGQLVAVRAVYGGKVHGRYVAAPSAKGCLATVRGGAFAAEPPTEDAGGAVHAEACPAGLGAGRTLLETVAPEAGAVDITQADRLVAVGRGIEEEENLEIVQSLASALGAELACSRPVVDKGWLPKSRQVGTSGVTVKPKLYVAVGISGSFQHVGGLKGSPYVVAINKDARAPIFAVADVGIVGDLFDVVPALEAKLKDA